MTKIAHVIKVSQGHMAVRPRGRSGLLGWGWRTPHYGISFIAAIRRGFKKYATFSGRASRSDYWWWALFSFIVYVVLLVPAYVLGITTSSDGGRTPGAAAIPLIILMVIFYLAIIVPTLALTVRRLHDAGYSGWLALLMLVPYVGGLIILIFAVLPSSPAGVKYDPVPATPPNDNPYQPQNSYPTQDSYPAQNTYPPEGH